MKAASAVYPNLVTAQLRSGNRTEAMQLLEVMAKTKVSRSVVTPGEHKVKFTFLDQDRGSCGKSRAESGSKAGLKREATRVRR